MKEKWLAAVGVLSLALAAAFAFGSATVQAEDAKTYSVKITNLTDGQPFTPPVLAVHSAAADVFEVGSAASAEVQAIAENGNIAPLIDLLGGLAAVSQVVAGSGPVLPGASQTLMIEASDGEVISWVSMLICTNDGFTGLDSLAISATTVETQAYDAGTEINTEDFADIVPPCQSLTPVSSSDDGTGETNPDLAEGGVIVMHPGVGGLDDLTATHKWSGAVASVTIAVAETTVTPPSTGSAGLAGGNGGSLVLVATALGLILLGSAGASLAYARRR